MQVIDSHLEIEYKQLKKQLKLMRGLASAPPEHQIRLSNLLDEIRSKTELNSEEEIERRLVEIQQAKEDGESKVDEIPKDVRLKCWFLRPLLSHLDHPSKIQHLADSKIGLGGLQNQLKLYIPPEWNLPIDNYSFYRRFFSFKAYGKGSVESKMLEEEFFEVTTLSNVVSFTVEGLTDLPMLHYNLDRLWHEIKDEHRDVCIVSGLCPLSLITNELTFELSSGEKIRMELGFEPLTVPEEKISSIIFPPRPILGDYVELVRIFRLAKFFFEQSGGEKIRLKLWLPLYEYEYALKNETLINLVQDNQVDPNLIQSNMNLLKERYKQVVEFVKRDVGYNGDLKLAVTDERSLKYQKEELCVLLEKPIDEIIEQIPLIYGIFKGSELRKELFALLCLKHIEPLLEDPEVNVLHMENSYEIWPSVLASRWAEQWKDSAVQECRERRQTFSFLCIPPSPSTSLRYMRDLNAPYEHKLYLAEAEVEFQTHLEQLKPKYLDLISTLLSVSKKDLIPKLRELNNIF